MSEHLRRVRHGAAGDAGFTLAELLVTIFLSMLVMALVTGLVQTSRGVLVTERARTNDLAVAFPAIDQVQRSVRAAVPRASGAAAVESASSNSVTYYTLNYTEPTPLPSDGVEPSKEELAKAEPRKVTLWLDDATDRLLMTTVPPTWDSATGWHYPDGQGKTRVLASGVTNTSAEPVFRYLPESGTSPLTSLASDGDRANIAFVEVHLQLDTNNGAGRPVEVVDTVRLANYGTEG